MTHSALSFGVPTIGIVGNNDQLLNMIHIQDSGAGVLLRYWNLDNKILEDSIKDVLENPKYKKAAQKIKSDFSKYNLTEKIEELLSA